MAGYGSGRYGRWRYSRTPNDLPVRLVSAWPCRSRIAGQRIQGAAVGSVWPWGGSAVPNKTHNAALASRWVEALELGAERAASLMLSSQWRADNVFQAPAAVYSVGQAVIWRERTTLYLNRIFNPATVAMFTDWGTSTLIRPTYTWEPDRSSPRETWVARPDQENLWVTQDAPTEHWSESNA